MTLNDDLGAVHARIIEVRAENLDMLSSDAADELGLAAVDFYAAWQRVAEGRKRGMK